MGSAALVRDKIQRILVDELGLEVRLISNGFQVPYASSAVNIIVHEDDDDDRTIIQMWAMVLRDVAESPELFEWIAVEGHQFFFGHACFNRNPQTPGIGMISFDYTLLGDYLDKAELEEALAALATTADGIDDQLQERFGGKRFLDN
jgi:hypothetical protein